MSLDNVGPGTISRKIKHAHKLQGRRLSLKAFVRQAVKGDDAELATLAKLWLKNKSVRGQTPRSVANVNLAATIGAAVKQSRRGTKK